MKTDELINMLATDLKPVRRLPPPAWRLIGWLAVSVPVMVLIVATMRMRADIGVKLTEPVFLMQELASLATALIAGWAALVTCVPGEPDWKRWTPVAPLALWMATLGHQCWDEWMHLGLSAMAFYSDLMCLPVIAMTSAVPALAMVLAIRRGACLPVPCAVWWGSLAAAALANVALRLFHTEDAALMVIVWQFGSVLLFMTLLSLCRRYLVPERTVCSLR